MILRWPNVVWVWIFAAFTVGCGKSARYAETKAKKWVEDDGNKDISGIKCGVDPRQFLPMEERAKASLPAVPSGYVFCSLLIDGDLHTLLECPSASPPSGKTPAPLRGLPTGRGIRPDADRACCRG